MTFSDFTIWEGEDYRRPSTTRGPGPSTIYQFMALAIPNFFAVNGGRLTTATIRKGDKPLLSWRVAILPFLEQFAALREVPSRRGVGQPSACVAAGRDAVCTPVAHKDTTPYATHYQGFVGPGAVFDGKEGTRIADVIDAATPTLMSRIESGIENTESSGRSAEDVAATAMGRRWHVSASLGILCIVLEHRAESYLAESPMAPYGIELA